jgi:hypothetical protein|tara:strand:- start:4029 stop:4355 length:327 start_codon:yes stop_codon:yes gene_type:complete
MNVLIKPKVTKPWSNEMYNYNDEVADIMKTNIIKSIEKNKSNWKVLNQLIDLCGEVRYGDGYTHKDLYEGCLKAVENAQNYWLAEEYPYAVEQGLVDDVMYKFVGYEK